MVGDKFTIHGALVGHFPGFPPRSPFFGGYEIVRSQILAGRVVFACDVVGGDEFPVLFVGIHIVARYGMLHNGVSVCVMEIVEVFVARSITVQNGSVGLC